MKDPIGLEMKIALILRQACFSQFSPSEAETLAELLQEKHFKQNTIIVTEGDRVDSIFLLVEGTVDVQKTSVQPDYSLLSTSVASLGPGDSIGLSTTGFYSLTGKRTATIVALSDVIALKLSVAAFNGFALSHSHVTEVMRANAGFELGKNPLE